MTETKIPMQIFTSYEALTQYYGDRDDCELGLYVSDNELLVGHAPTAYSFNPQYFTGYNELLPDYAPPSVIDYTVNAESNNSTYGYVTGGGTYPQHSEITLNAYAYNGYKFDKWSNDVETAAYTFAVEEDVDLTAIFVDNTYTVTLTQSTPYGGTVSGAGTYIANSSVIVSATPNEGYYFISWYNKTLQQIVSSDSEYTFTLVEDTELRADFGQYRTVSATPNNVDYGSTTGSGNQYKRNDSVTVTATPETGYRFVNWTEDNVEVSTSSSYTFRMGTNDVTLVANFEAATANINISANNPTYGSVDAAGSTVIGDNYTVMAEANTGYVFVNWTEDGVEVSTNANYTFTVTGDRTLVANFAEDPKLEPFYVENITNANETLSIYKAVSSGAPTLTIEYSSDKTNWNTLGTTSLDAIQRTIAPGEKLYLRCTTDRWAASGASVTRGNMIIGVSKIGGNIMSLLKGSSFTGNETELPASCTFIGLFAQNTNLISAEKLILPATTLKNYCYRDMFKFCTNLTSIPELPATTLTDSCYREMFSGCTNLNNVKCLASTFGNNSTQNWLNDVSATGTFVKAAGVSWSSGASGIPSGWTVVEEAVSA